MAKYSRSTYGLRACVLLLICAGSASTSFGQIPADSQGIARLWVERLGATMEENASAADIDRLLELYAEDAVYEHPRANARVEGKERLRQGTASHLGETRNPRLQITRILFGEAFAVVEMKVKLEVRQEKEWLPVERRQVVVLELKDSRIQRVIDHWDH